jgi:hypothetical protein
LWSFPILSSVSRLGNTKFETARRYSSANSEITLPHVFVGGEAYPLTTCLMKPYSRRTLDKSKAIFNYVYMLWKVLSVFVLQSEGFWTKQLTQK